MATEILSIDEMTAAQADKYLTHNTANRQLEAQMVRVLDRDAGAAPGSPAEGDTYIVDVASGAWASATVNDIAHYYSSTWKFYTPVEGMRVWVNDEDKLYVYYSAAWNEFASGGSVIVRDESSPTGTTQYSAIVFDNSTLTDNGDGSITVTTAGVYVEDNQSPVSALTFDTLVFAGDSTVVDNGDGSATVTVTGAAGTIGVYVDDNNSPISGALFTKLIFTGSSVTTTDNGDGSATIDVAAAAGGGTVTVLDNDESPEINVAADTIEFAGAGVTVTDQGAGNVLVTVPGAASGSVTVSTKTADYTLTATDNGSVIEMNSASAINLLIPEDVSENLDVGFNVTITQIGAGQVTVASTAGSPASNVTIKSKDSNTKLTGQYSSATLYKRGADDWVLFGDLSA